MISLLAQAADILGELPESEDIATSMLQQRATDQGNDWLSELDDLSSLIDAMLILDNKSIFVKPDPFKRTGKLLDIEAWLEHPEVKLLVDKCKEDGWIVQGRTTSFNFERAGKTQFKIRGLREAKSGGLSTRVLFPRVKTYVELEVYLNSLDLVEFTQKKWSTDGTHVEAGHEIQGRYFFFHEVHLIMDKITERLPNDKKTEKLAGFQPNPIRKSSTKHNKDS